MNRREREEVDNNFLQVYCGALYNFQTFQHGEPFSCSFDFDDPLYDELKAKYPIEAVAGRGGDFERALRLARWLSPNLMHRGDYELSDDRRTVP